MEYLERRYRPAQCVMLALSSLHAKNIGSSPLLPRQPPSSNTFIVLPNVFCSTFFNLGAHVLLKIWLLTRKTFWNGQQWPNETNTKCFGMEFSFNTESTSQCIRDVRQDLCFTSLYAPRKNLSYAGALKTDVFCLGKQIILSCQQFPVLSCHTDQSTSPSSSPTPRNQLCRAKQYCKTVGDRQGELHDLLEKLMTKAQKLSDSSVSLYFFSASLYLVKVLRGGVPGASAESKTILSTEEVSLYLSDFTTVTEVGP